MNPRLVAVITTLLLTASPALAHQLDEYLQATTISVEKGRISAEMRLTPGVAVLPYVLSGIDTNSDGVLSTDEQRAYVERVLGDLSLTVNTERLHLKPVSWSFATVAKMKEGLGDITIRFRADVPDSGRDRKLIFENHHARWGAAYMANCLIPGDPTIHITAQNRNYEQSHYELDYVQEGSIGPPALHPGRWLWSGLLTLLFFVPLTLLWWQRVRHERVQGTISFKRPPVLR